MSITNAQVEIIEDLPLDGNDKWYVLLAVTRQKKASWLQASSAVWREGDQPIAISPDRIEIIKSRLDRLGIFYHVLFRDTDAGLWQPSDTSKYRLRYNQLADIFIGTTQDAADELLAAYTAWDHTAIGLALDYPPTAVAAFDTDDVMYSSQVPEGLFPEQVLDNTYFVLSKGYYKDELAVVQRWSDALENTGSAILMRELGKTYL